MRHLVKLAGLAVVLSLGGSAALAATPADIDQLVAAELQQAKLTPAPRTTDEQFVRRVYLDLIGKLPVPADVTEFVADRDPGKRGKLIDRLLASDDYARHWARYWREVITSRILDPRNLQAANAFEDWLTSQLEQNKGWHHMVRTLITAHGAWRQDQPNKNGEAFLLLSRQGNDAPMERAAETARLFLGIQLQCAQCHDHPYDRWKRTQFHELVGYFARLDDERIREGQRIVGVELKSRRFRDHYMLSKDDPATGTKMEPRFLDGKAPPRDLSDLDRRKALADQVTDKNNPWFAAAFVNRIWGELLGQAFYQPVDDMGPDKDAVAPTVLARLAESFRATDHDVRAFFRLVLNTETYQRQARLGSSADEHLHFAASYPKRLPADAIWASLSNVLGNLEPQSRIMPRLPMGPFAGARTPEAAFREEFGFDPSLKADEVEGSIPQALLLMNNPQLEQRLRAQGNNLLGRVLRSYPKDDEALRVVYLRALARTPSERELAKCRGHIAKAPGRAEAYEDILWALINSTEFQTRR